MQSQLLSIMIKRSVNNFTRNKNGKSFEDSFDDQTLDNTSTNSDTDVMGSPSDYILVGMIVLLVLCIAVCCLCLFCRPSSHCTICGFNFEVNDRIASVAGDDLSELHEVVPLTPTTIGNYNIPDIETKLQGDPPPPKYSDVASPANPSMFERFKRKSKRRGASVSEDKAAGDSSYKSSDIFGHNKSKQNHASHRVFQRSSSCQHPRVSSLKTGTSLANTDKSKSSKAGGFFSSLKTHSSLQHSVSDCTGSSRPMLSKEDISDNSVSSVVSKPQPLSLDKMHEEPENVLSLRDDVIHEEPEPSNQESSNELYDDEVFV